MSDGLTPIIVFRNNSSIGTEIIWTALSNINPPDVAFNFTPTNNDTVPSHYTNIGGGYVYSPPAPPAVPNINGFVQAVMADNTIPPNSQMGLASWYPQLSMFINQPNIVQAGWANLVATESSSWLPPTVQSSVLTYAQQNNIPLVP